MNLQAKAEGKPEQEAEKKSEPRPLDFDPLTSKKQFAEELGINLTTLWRWEKENHVPKSLRIGGRVGWPRSVIRQWKAEQGWPAFEEANGAGDAS